MKLWHKTPAQWSVRRLLFILTLVQVIAILWLHWGMPLASQHAFREAETADTVYWMLHGGPLIAYQTPVMGAPWQIPFEFPTFQWVVAGVVYATGMALDNAGRLVSVLFLLGSLVPLAGLAARHDVDKYVLGALFLGAPVYLYWGTGFLIETCVLFLCLMFLWMVEEQRWTLALSFAVLSAVTKLPVFLPFAGLAMVLMWRRWTVLSVGIALMCGLVWTQYTDHLKAQNPLSAVLVSSQPAQRTHDFGTLRQRLSPEIPETTWASIKDAL